MATCLHWWICLITLSQVLALPEVGVWRVTYNEKQTIHAFSKNVFSGTMISVTIACEGDEKVALNVIWSVRLSPCAQEYEGIDTQYIRQLSYLYRPEVQLVKDIKKSDVSFLMNQTTVECGGTESQIYLEDHTKDKPHVVTGLVLYLDNDTADSIVNVKPAPTAEATDEAAAGRRKRAATAAAAPVAAKSTSKPVVKINPEIDTANPKPAPTAKTTAKATDKAAAERRKRAAKPEVKIDHSMLATFWQDGYYVFVLQFKPQRRTNSFSAEVTVRMPGPHGYISAVDFPLKIFYGLMGLVYIIYGIVWLVLLGCNWRDLLRVQFWIGGVIILGLLEKAVFFAMYESIAKSGESVRSWVIVAELVTVMRRAFHRMLIIVLSLGFETVKPRLGQTIHKVLCVGVMYFVLGSIEGCMRALKSKSDQSNHLMLAAVPLAVLDAFICWWIFSSLFRIIRTLRFQQNVVHLSLYRYFKNALIVSILASIAFMIWNITQHKLKACITEWRDLWLDKAFWHLDVLVLHLVIMILWRPTAKNKRIAFSPLLDATENNVDDAVWNNAVDGMKMRSEQVSNGSPEQKSFRKSEEDYLKWVGESNPSFVCDNAQHNPLDLDKNTETWM